MLTLLQEKISATVDKLTHKSGTNANTGHTGTGTTASDYRDNTTSGVGATDYNKNSGLGTTSGGNTGNLETGGVFLDDLRATFPLSMYPVSASVHHDVQMHAQRSMTTASSSTTHHYCQRLTAAAD